MERDLSHAALVAWLEANRLAKLVPHMDEEVTLEDLLSIPEPQLQEWANSIKGVSSLLKLKFMSAVRSLRQSVHQGSERERVPPYDSDASIGSPKHAYSQSQSQSQSHSQSGIGGRFAEGPGATASASSHANGAGSYDMTTPASAPASQRRNGGQAGGATAGGQPGVGGGVGVAGGTTSEQQLVSLLYEEMKAVSRQEQGLQANLEDCDEMQRRVKRAVETRAHSLKQKVEERCIALVQLSRDCCTQQKALIGQELTKASNWRQTLTNAQKHLEDLQRRAPKDMQRQVQQALRDIQARRPQVYMYPALVLNHAVEDGAQQEAMQGMARAMGEISDQTPDPMPTSPVVVSMPFPEFEAPELSETREPSQTLSPRMMAEAQNRQQQNLQLRAKKRSSRRQVSADFGQARGQLVAQEKDSVLLDMDLNALSELRPDQTPSQQLAAVQRSVARLQQSSTGNDPTTVRTALARVASANDAMSATVPVGAFRQRQLAQQRSMHGGRASAQQHPDDVKFQERAFSPRKRAPPKKKLPKLDMPAEEKQEKHKKKGRRAKARIPPPPKTPPPEYVAGYDSDESLYTPQFARSRRKFSVDDADPELLSKQKAHKRSKTRLTDKYMTNAQANRTRRNKMIGLPDKRGELTKKEFYAKYWIEAGKLGEGSFSRVRKITRKHDRKVFALKVIKKEGKSQEDLEALQREITLLQKLQHPNVVSLVDWVYADKRIFMVVEFCEGGDVFQRIVAQKTFSEHEAAFVIRQVTEGLAHCHSKGVVHRDLKPDNLMYLTTETKSRIMIIDFGLAGDASENPLTTPCGTAHYVAPEVLYSKGYGTQADMWSLGVIIYMLLCGFPPFFDPAGNQKRLYKLIKNAKYRFPSPYWDHISKQGKDLIKHLLKKDPAKRMSAAKALDHPWIQGAATKAEIGDLYMEQMRHFESSRHFTNVKLSMDEHEPPAPPPRGPLRMFAHSKYAYNYDDQ